MVCRLEDVHHFLLFLPSQTEKGAVSVLINTLCKAKKSLTVNQFVFSFVFPLVSLISSSVLLILL